MTRRRADIAALLLLLGAPLAEAQTSGRAQMQDAGPSAKPKERPDKIRELVCRGKPGLQITPWGVGLGTPREVAVMLTYTVSSRPAGDAYRDLEPGACTWNPTRDPQIKTETGVVQFYLARAGSAFVPDSSTLPIYLGDPAHYWRFFVDDFLNISRSHGAYLGRFFVGERRGDQQRTARVTSFRREELRCRGGPGLAFARGNTAGANLVTMTLRYRVAAGAAGTDARGLDPGTCAWVDRTDAQPEPGRVAFVTSANAQLRQIQSGTTLDRSPTAAERFADAITIPPYMADPRHYWSFGVSLADPDSAHSHAVWRRPIGDIITATPPAEVPTTVSSPVSGAASTPAAAGPAGASTTRAGAGVTPRR